MSQSQQIIARLYEKFQSLIPEVTAEVQEVYQTAIDYYGEENVDLQVKCPDIIFTDYLRNIYLRDFVSKFDIDIHAHPTLERFHNHTAEQVFEGHENVLECFLELLTPEILKAAYRTYAYCILVRFQNFEVRNEQDTTTMIEEMFTLTTLDYKGRMCGRMYWCRTETNTLHRACGYRHSHLPTGGSSYCQWNHPCLGNGPICMTINSLESECSLDLWPLYWHELDMCIRVESLTGGPYIKISEINSKSLVTKTIEGYTHEVKPINVSGLPYSEEVLKDVIERGNLRFRWNRNHIEIANSLVDFTLEVSNSYLEILLRHESASTTALLNIPEVLDREMAIGRVYWGRFTDKDTVEVLRNGNIESEEYRSTLDWKFKGEPAVFHIKNTMAEIKKYTLLESLYVSQIYNNLTLLVNATYGRNKNSIKPNRKRNSRRS